MRQVLQLLVFIVICVGGGALIGVFTGADQWYQALEKPWFNPPSWVFAPVWTALYLLIAIVGYRTWARERFGFGMLLWIVQLVLNFLWSPVFFGLHLIGGALAVILLLLMAILTFMAYAARLDRGSCLLFVPYLVWVGFATLLNASIYLLN
jgi:benzodiazapine receptor